MAKLTIVVDDNAVTKNGVGHGGLDLSSCGIPSNVAALQWDNTAGEIEFDTAIDNEAITELPAWATACEAVWQTAEDAEPEEEAAVPTETFWADYPNASETQVNKILAKNYPGIVNEKALDPNDVLKGIQTTVVADGNTALTSLSNLKNDCIAAGVPPMSDMMGDDVTSNFITYMTDTLGYTLYTATNRVYWAWSGDIVSNKADKDINDQRDVDFDAGVTWDNKTWQIDLVSRNNIMNQLTAITSGIYTDANVTWRTADNTDVTLTVEQFKQLATAVNNRVEEIYTTSFTDKE